MVVIERYINIHSLIYAILLFNFTIITMNSKMVIWEKDIKMNFPTMTNC